MMTIMSDVMPQMFWWAGSAPWHSSRSIMSAGDTTQREGEGQRFRRDSSGGHREGEGAE
jgi:hypothetical protein